MPRKVEEWIGKTPDAKAPPRVRMRCWQREDGICYLTGRKIMPGEPWDLDHKVALINGGENRESNLFPVLRDKHREKTALDVAEKARVASIASRHVGAKRPKQTIKSAPFPQRAHREPRPVLPPRPLYEDRR